MDRRAKMTQRKNVIAVTPGGNITMEHILGFYALFTVPDQPVSASKLARLWASEGLPAGVVPNERKAVHAFQFACRSIESRRRIGVEQSEEQISVDEVYETVDECVYQVTRVVRDRANRVIDHPKTMRITFDKDSEKISWDRLSQKVSTELADSLGEAVKGHFEKNVKKVPGARVRSAIRALMTDVGATNVRKKAGGVYFVPKDGKTYLDALGKLLEELYGEDADLHLIFAANAEGERAMIEKHFTLNVSQEVDELMAEVSEALTGEGRKLRKDRVNNILAQRKALGDTRQKYASLLDNELEVVGEKVDLLDEQLEALLMSQAAE
jgi:hypothetical protein